MGRGRDVARITGQGRGIGSPPQTNSIVVHNACTINSKSLMTWRGKVGTEFN